MSEDNMTIGHSQLTKLVESAKEETEAALWVRLNKLEAQLHQQQQIADRRYSKLKSQLEGIHKQLAKASQWAKEAAVNSSRQYPPSVWLLASVALNILLMLSIALHGKG